MHSIDLTSNIGYWYMHRELVRAWFLTLLLGSKARAPRIAGLVLFRPIATSLTMLIQRNTTYLFRGRFAVVKKCLQKCSNQYVAVKYLNRRQTRKEEVEMEFNILQSLQHENLVQLYDLYETASNLLNVMEQ